MRRQLYALGVCSAVICTAPASGAAAAEAAPDLRRSNICSLKGAVNVAGAQVIPTKGTMSNDGGWCWYMFTTNMHTRVVGAPMHVTKAPSHGEVKIDVLEKSARIAYKPQPGFVGEDQFSVISDMLNIDVPHFVTVRPASGQSVLARTVSAGTTLGVDHYYYLHPDCSFAGYADIRVRSTPGHGTVAIEPVEGYSSYPVGNQRYNCNREKSKLLEVKYTPAQGYTGPDQFEVFVIWPNGTTYSRLYAVTVQ